MREMIKGAMGEVGREVEREEGRVVMVHEWCRCRPGVHDESHELQVQCLGILKGIFIL